MTQNTNADQGRVNKNAAANDGVTDLVIRRFPDEALMRRRAYSQSVNRSKAIQRPAILGPTRQA